MTLHPIRFVLGLVQILVILGLAIFALGFNPMDHFIPGVLFPKYEILCWPHVKALFQILVFYVLVSLPFDFLSGWVTPKLVRQPCPGFFRYLAGLVGGIVAHAATMLFLGILTITFAQRFGGAAIWIYFVALLGLMAFLSVSKSFPGQALRFWLNPIAGWPSLREEKGSTERVSGFKAALAMGWVLLGLGLASRHPQASFACSAGLLTVGLVLTVWMGVTGLLVGGLAWAVGDRIPLLSPGRVEAVLRLGLFLSISGLCFVTRAHPAVVGNPAAWADPSGD